MMVKNFLKIINFSIYIFFTNCLTRINGSAAKNPDTEPHFFAIASNASVDRGCGKISYFIFITCHSF